MAVVAFLSFSCSLTKENKLYRSHIKGTWQLTEVAYSGAKGQFSSVLFKDAEEKCFERSEWYFNSNNSTGYYNIIKGQDCTPGQRDIRWSIISEGGVQQLQFKTIDAKRKDINDYGFRLYIDYLDDYTMRLRSNVNAEGEAVNVIYKFQRI